MFGDDATTVVTQLRSGSTDSIMVAHQARQVQSKIKAILLVFFDIRGIVHHEYAPEGQTVIKEYYQVFHLLHDAVPPKRPARSSHQIQIFLAKHGIPVVHQPPYSPDMAPCDFWLFLKLKTALKGTRFERREEIIQNAKAEMNIIPKQTQGVYLERD